MKEDILLNGIIKKVECANLISCTFLKKDYSKLKSSKFKFTIKALNMLFIKIGYINNGIIDAYSSKNFYVINILKRTLIEAYFKHLYIFTISLREDSDSVGKEYINTLRLSEDLSALKLISNYTKESNFILNSRETKWSFGGDKNKIIEDIGKKFDLKQIFHELLKSIVSVDKQDNNISKAFKEGFFIKYIKEYADSSSFIHAGSYSDEVFESFQLLKDKEKIFDSLLKDSFSLYEYAIKNTFLFFSLMNQELNCYNKVIESIFSKDKESQK